MTGSAAAPAAATLLEHATLGDGRIVEVRIADGVVGEVADRSEASERAERVLLADRGAVGPRPERYDVGDQLLLAAAAEPHTHLDKAFLAGRFPNPAGDLAGAFVAMERAYESAMTRSDITERVLAVLGLNLQRGYTAIRSHVNCERGIGTLGVEVLCAIRDRVADVVDLQIVPLASKPVTGLAGADQRAILKDAVGVGVDLMGGFPQADEHPIDAMRFLVQLAAEAGLPVDLHLDETTDPDTFVLGEYAAEVVRNGLSGRATASHCVSLGQQDPDRITRTAEDLAAAGVGVVTLPQTNLLIQGRGTETRVPRGLTAVAALRRAGVVVAAGGDNRRDPFNQLGRVDPFETAALAVAAAHLTPEEAWRAVSADVRTVLGLPPAGPEPGARADLLAIKARDVPDAVAAADLERWVFRGGVPVARTRVVDDLDARAVVKERCRGVGTPPAAG